MRHSIAAGRTNSCVGAKALIRNHLTPDGYSATTTAGEASFHSDLQNLAPVGAAKSECDEIRESVSFSAAVLAQGYRTRFLSIIGETNLYIWSCFSFENCCSEALGRVLSRS